MYSLHGKTWPTHHTLSTLSPRIVHNHTYLTWSAYSNLWYSHQQIWTDPLHPRRRAPDTIHSTTVIRSVGPYPASLPQQPKSSREKSSSCWQPTTRLTGAYHQHAIGTFNTCLRGPTERSLIDTGGGYNFEGAGLPHTHFPTFPTSCLPFSLVALPGLQFNQAPLLKPRCWVLKNLWLTRGLSTTRSSIVAYIYT
jgi:hypothetical protein